MAQRVSRAEVLSLTEPLTGLPVSRAWRGQGTTLFLELGALGTYERTGHPKGEAAVMVDWDWRVEGPRSVLFGSSSSDRRLARGVAGLTGGEVALIAVEGRLPELVMALADGRVVRSFAAVDGQPRWTVFLLDGTWLEVARGGIVRVEGREFARRGGAAQRGVAADEAAQPSATGTVPSGPPRI